MVELIFIAQPLTSLSSRSLWSAGMAAEVTETPVASTSALEPPANRATFASLGVEPFLCKALQAMAIRKPTGVQAACIPQILAGADCIGSAQTGSGKTIAFALPIMQALSRDPYGVFGVVLTPTRELAFQIGEQFRVLGAAMNLHSTVIVGGMDMMHQAIELRKQPHIIIATPGRLVDLMKSNQGEFSLGRVKFLVLDEADRLLTSTFAPELSYIIDQLPSTRQTLLFTATLTEPVLALQNKPQMPGKPKVFTHVSREVITTPAGLTQRYVFVPSQVREVYLTYLLINLCALTGAQPLHASAPSKPSGKGSSSSSKKREEAEETGPVLPQTILFVPHCRTAALLHSLFSQLPSPIPCTSLHSHLTQADRLKSLAMFRRQAVPLLIATDVGSRGLDIPEVAVVVNWEVPRVPEDYIHRVGRTARAGRKGTAITFVTEGDVDLVQVLEERIGTQLQELELPEEPVLELLNSVSMAKRMANMELHSEGFGARQENNKKKHGMYKASQQQQKGGKGQNRSAQAAACRPTGPPHLLFVSTSSSSSTLRSRARLALRAMGDDYPAVGTTFSLPLPVVLDSLRAVRPLLPSPPTSTSSTDEVRLEPRQVELQTRTHPLGKGVTVKCKLGSRKGGRRRPGEKRLSDDELCSFRLVLQLSESPIDPSIPSYVVTESLPHSHYTHHHHHTLFPRDCLENDVNSITLDPSPSSRIDFENRLLVFRSGYTVPILHSDIPRTTAHYRSSNRRRPAASLDHDENWQFWEDALEVDGAGEAKRKRRKVVMDMGGLGALKEWGWVDGLDEYGEEEEPFEEEIAQNGVVAMETEGADGGTEGHRDAGQPRGEIGDGQDAGDEGEQNGVASASPSPPPSLSPEALQALQPSTKRRRSTTTGSPAWLPGIARSSRRATRRVASAEVFEATDTEGDIYGAVAAEQQEQIDEMDEAMREEEEALDKLASDVAAFLIRPQRMQITSQSVTISNIAAPSPLTPFTPPARNFPPPSPTSPADSSVTASSPADSYFSPCGERDTSLSSVETPTRTFARPRARSVRFADEEEAKHVRAAALSASAGEVVEHKQEEKYELVSDDVDKEREKQALQALLGLSGWRPQPPPPPSDVIQQSASAAPDPQAPPSPAASHALPEGSGATATSQFPAGASPSATSALAFRPRVSSKPAPRRPTPTSALFIPSARKSAPTFSSRASKPFMPPSLQASGASRAVAVAQASAREKEGRQQQQGTSGGGRVGGTTLSAKDETALAEAFRERLWRSGGDFEGGRLDSLYSAATLAKKLELIRTVTPFPTSPILRTPSSAIYLSILSKPHRPSRARLPSLQSLPTFDTPPDILSLFNRIRLALEYLYGRSVSTNEMAFLERREKAVWALARTMAAVAEVNERAMRVRRSGVEQDEPRWQARG
uniref:BY PROTMAP: gi/342321531/gb/EGU13464.1/ ATP-dependent RNA helicase DBP8 [Rhodotorula glutinis ATCC 204091] n=2 Tax=Rhodotorula toruloides TaxID=5286 RepID=A0A0K3CFT9_RHOTO